MLCGIGSMVLQDIMYQMVAIVKPILFEGGVESIGDIASTISDDCREFCTQAKQLVLLQCKD